MPASSSMVMTALLPEHDGGDTGKPSARTAGHRHLGPGNLCLARLATELADRFVDEEDPAHPGVAGRQPATVGVERLTPARAGARRSRRTDPPSPFLQKPMSSSSISTVMVKLS